MNEITGFDDKLRLFKEAAERIDKELNHLLAYSENLTTEMLAGTPEHDYSIDAAKKMSEQFSKIRDKIYKIFEKMLVRRHMVWEIFYKREQGLLDEYLALYNDGSKEKLREQLEIYTTLQRCWGDDFGPRH